MNKTVLPRTSWFVPEMTGKELALIKRALDANFINDGPLTTEFEARIASLIGVKFCVAVTSGTAAIALALMATGVGPGDEVIIPDLTFIATANAARLAGADVRLADVEPERFGIARQSVIESITERTKAIVAVDVNGRGADYRWLEPFCRERGLRLVCDSAEGLGSKFDGRYLGSFGDAGCFSFSPAKTVTTGQGGMVATNSSMVHDRLRELKDQGRRYRGTGGDDTHPVLGFNFKFTDLQAAVGLAQLDQLESRLAAARRRDEMYREALSDCPGVVLPDTDSEPGEIRQWADALFEDRRRAQRALDAHGIDYRPFWHPLHTQPPYETPARSFAAASDISSRGLWMPSHFSLSRSDVLAVAEALRS